MGIWETSSQPRTFPHSLAAPGIPRPLAEVWGPSPSSPLPLYKGTCALPFLPPFPSWAVLGSRPGWVEADCGLCSSFWKNLSSWGDLPLVLFEKQNMFCRRQARLIAGWESYGQLLPPLGSHMKRSHPGGAGGRGASAEHSASSGTVPLGSSRARL